MNLAKNNKMGAEKDQFYKDEKVRKYFGRFNLEAKICLADV